MDKVAEAPVEYFEASMISVVVPVYNSGAFLYEAVESIRAQDVPVPVEIIIVDDRSTDPATLKALKHYSSLGGNVQVIKNDGPRGPGAARNSGVRASRGKWLAFLDADDLLPPDSLRARHEVATRFPEAKFISGDFRAFSEDGTEYSFGQESVAKFGEETDADGVYVASNLSERLVTLTLVNTGTVLVLRKVFVECGGFKQKFYYGEDWYLWMLLSECYELFYIEQIVMRYRVGHPSLMSSPRRFTGESCGAFQAAYFDRRLRRLRRPIRWRIVRHYEKISHYHYTVSGKRMRAAKYLLLAWLWSPNDLSHLRDVARILLRQY